jgi:sugar phosphate isomerase/epimerase
MELAPQAADAGVVIAMENGDTHQWEHALLERFGLPRTSLSDHHARTRIPPIVRQLEAIDHPNVGLTVDVAHLHIAARDIGFDELEAATQAAPWVRHVHVSDNFGQLDRGYATESDRWAFGEADMHMPPGWGDVPYRDLFARWPEYRGRVVMELTGPFFDFAAQGMQELRKLVAST